MRGSFEEVGTEFIHARGRPFENDPLGHLVRKDLPHRIRAMLAQKFPDILVRGSVGQGVWATVPWIAFFDPSVTTSATQGYYVVYLFDAQMQTLYLSLNQGTTAVYQEFGTSAGRRILADRARMMAARLARYSHQFDVKEIDLHSEKDLPKGYEAGHSIGKSYDLAALPSDQQLLEDLLGLLSAYADLIFLGGITPTEDMLEAAQTSVVTEARTLALSMRIERKPNTRKKVLQHKKAICEGCGLDPRVHHSLPEDLPPSRTPVEVHHLIPLHVLARDERFDYTIPDDFAVLCPSCHRVIHLQNDPSDMDELRSRVRFRFMKEVTEF